MEIFIDTASTTEINKWLTMGVIDGVTTNPSVMLKSKVYDTRVVTREISSLVDPLPVFVEVTTNDLDEMLTQARGFAAEAPNIGVKIPQENQDGVPCYGVIHQLEEEGIRINATAALSLSQVMLAAKAGASYISIFSGRISDEGGNASEVIRRSVDWLERWNFKGKIVVGSIRSVADVLQAAMAGAHIITITPEFLGKMADHKYTRETVKQFVDDARKAEEIMDGMTLIEKNS